MSVKDVLTDLFYFDEETQDPTPVDDGVEESQPTRFFNTEDLIFTEGESVTGSLHLEEDEIDLPEEVIELSEDEIIADLPPAPPVPKLPPKGIYQIELADEMDASNPERLWNGRRKRYRKLPGIKAVLEQSIKDHGVLPRQFALVFSDKLFEGPLYSCFGAQGLANHLCEYLQDFLKDASNDSKLKKFLKPAKNQANRRKPHVLVCQYEKKVTLEKHKNPIRTGLAPQNDLLVSILCSPNLQFSANGLISTGKETLGYDLDLYIHDGKKLICRKNVETFLGDEIQINFGESDIDNVPLSLFPGHSFELGFVNNHFRFNYQEGFKTDRGQFGPVSSSFEEVCDNLEMGIVDLKIHRKNEEFPYFVVHFKKMVIENAQYEWSIDGVMLPHFSKEHAKGIETYCIGVTQDNSGDFQFVENLEGAQWKVEAQASGKVVLFMPNAKEIIIPTDEVYNIESSLGGTWQIRTGAACGPEFLGSGMVLIPSNKAIGQLAAGTTIFGRYPETPDAELIQLNKKFIHHRINPKVLDREFEHILKQSKSNFSINNAYISRDHCRLDIDENGAFSLVNLSEGIPLHFNTHPLSLEGPPSQICRYNESPVDFPLTPLFLWIGPMRVVLKPINGEKSEQPTIQVENFKTVPEEQIKSLAPPVSPEVKSFPKLVSESIQENKHEGITTQDSSELASLSSEEEKSDFSEVSTLDNNSGEESAFIPAQFRSLIKLKPRGQVLGFTEDIFKTLGFEPYREYSLYMDGSGRLVEPLEEACLMFHVKEKQIRLLVKQPCRIEEKDYQIDEERILEHKNCQLRITTIVNEFTFEIQFFSQSFLKTTQQAFGIRTSNWGSAIPLGIMEQTAGRKVEKITDIFLPSDTQGMAGILWKDIPSLPEVLIHLNLNPNKEKLAPNMWNSPGKVATFTDDQEEVKVKRYLLENGQFAEGNLFYKAQEGEWIPILREFPVAQATELIMGSGIYEVISYSSSNHENN